MGHIVKSREKKSSAHQHRMRVFEESVYQARRRYQDGKFGNGCVRVGQLTTALTLVFDAIKKSADETFPHRGAR